MIHWFHTRFPHGLVPGKGFFFMLEISSFLVLVGNNSKLEQKAEELKIKM